MAGFLFPFAYVPDPNKGKPVALGELYFGEADKDPESFPIQVYAKQEDGTLIAISLGGAIELSAGGVPTYNGSPVQLVVFETPFSLRVRSKNGAQVYYAELVEGVPISSSSQILSFNNLADAIAYPVISENLGDIVETGERTDGTGLGGALYKIVSADPGYLGTMNHLKTDGSGYYLELIGGSYQAYVSGALANDGTRDDTQAIQDWFDWHGDKNLTDLNLGGVFTTERINITAKNNNATIHSGGLYSTATRSNSNDPMIQVQDTSNNIDNISFINFKLLGRAQYTGDRAADLAANIANNMNGSGLRVLGDLNGRIKNIFIDNVFCESLGNSGVQVNSVDSAEIGSVYGKYIYNHAFAAEVDGVFGAISSWPSDYLPAVSVQSIMAEECGTVFDFSTVGSSKTDNSGTYRPQGYIGSAIGKNISSRTKVDGNWNFEANLVSVTQDEYDVQNEGSWGAFNLAADIVKRCKIGTIYANKCCFAFGMASGGEGEVIIDDVQAYDCQQAVQRVRSNSKYGRIYCNGTYSPIYHTGDSATEVNIGDITVINSDKQYWIDNSPSNWGSPTLYPMNFTGGVDQVNIRSIYTENVGTSDAASQYLTFFNVNNNQTIKIDVVTADVAGANPPTNFYFNNAANGFFRFGVANEKVSVGATEFVRSTGASAYLFVDSLTTATGINDTFDGTLTQQGLNTYVWRNGTDYRGSISLPTAITDGSSIGTLS